MKGRANIATGLLFLIGFMVYGFFLIYLRDFAPGKEQWIADNTVGKHFESRLAHGHGNLFALINIAVGLVLMRLPVQQSSTRWIAGLALAGMLIPLGILSEVVLGVPPLLVNFGGISTVAAVAWLGMFGWRLHLTQGGWP
jgi:hypothetical protein